MSEPGLKVGEPLVQWVLLREESYLRSCLGLPLMRKLAEQLTTDFGRIDFAYELDNGQVAIVELETAIDNTTKFNYCTEQLTRYKQITLGAQQPLVVLLYNKASTPPRFQREIQAFAASLSVELREYSITQVLALYKGLIEQLRKTAGISLGRPLAMDVVYLRWLNKIMLPFYRNQADRLTQEEVRVVAGFRSPTSFGVYRALAENFELLYREGGRLVLTSEYGIRFRDNINILLLPQRSLVSVPELSLEQKRVLLESLLNGNFTKFKVNLYYFLRFLHITEGRWVPKANIAYDERWHRLANTFLGTTYSWETLTEFLRFAMNHCEELGLVARIPLQGAQHFQAVLTSLGSRVLGFLELYLHLKREQLQIPLDL